MNTQRWFFLLYLFIAPIIVAVSQASILEFPTVNALSGSTYDPFPRIFYFPALIGLFLLQVGAITISILATIKDRNVSRRFGNAIRVLSPLAFLYLFWFGINLSQRTVIVEYLNTVNTHQLPLQGMFYLPGMPEIFPKLGFLPFYVVVAVGIGGLMAMIVQSYLLLVKKPE
jgi:hypothetical protein